MTITKKLKSVQKDALEQYLQGIPIETIARSLKKNKNTIHTWKKKYGWEKYREDLNHEAKKEVMESNEERKKRLLKIAKGIQGRFVRDLENQEIKAMDAIRAMEFEAKLTGLDITRIEADIPNLSRADIIKIAQEEMDNDKRRERKP